MKYSRGWFEKWLDRHNHKMELVRTVFSFLAFAAGALVLMKLFGLLGD